MKVEKTALEGVILITPPTIFADHRGGYIELYTRDTYAKAGITKEFIEDDISFSHKNVLRGIHGDTKTTKLISCISGEFYLVVVNFNSESPEYRQWTSFMLSAKNPAQVLIPEKFGNGHLVTSEMAIFHYKQTETYDRSEQFTIRWNDPAIGVTWPIQTPILSERDAESPFLT